MPLIFLLAFQINAQVRKIVLLEVFTNSGCGTCANSNEILQNFYANYYGGVISVRYHPNFPDPRDPMYSDASADIDSRVAFYNILYTPQAVFDGEVFGSPENEKDLWETMLEKISRGSPVWIDVNSEISGDSLRTEIKIIGYGNLNEREMKLRAALVERMVYFDEPPGANGETEFPDVVRKMLPGAEGVSLNAISEGDTLIFNYSTFLSENWEAENLSVVAWVQSDVTKEVYQANSDIPTVIIEADEPDDREIALNSEYETNYTIENFSDKEIPLKINYETNLFYPNWNYELQLGGVVIDTLEIVIMPGETLNLTEFLQTDEHASALASYVSVRNLNDGLNYRYTCNRFSYVKNPDILIISTIDETELNEKIIPIVKDTLSLDFTAFRSVDTRYWLDVIERANFEAGLLISGNNEPVFEENDMKILLNLLDEGKGVFASGQRILSARGNFQASRNFCDNYLDIQFVERAQENEVAGKQNNLAYEMNFELAGAYIPEPEVVVSKNGNSRALFSLAVDTAKYVAMTNDAGNFKTVYTGFGVEEIVDARMRAELLRRIFRWFDVHPNGVAESGRLNYGFSLEQNYPNPFNPTTTIKYSIPKLDGVETQNLASLRIYNILGEKVATLINRKQSPGNYEVQFDASNLPSGIYIYTLSVGKFSETKKMLLLK